MPSFAGNQQQDAHEFTRFLLERLRLEFVRGDVLAEKARRAASLSLSAGAKDPLRRNVTPRGREHGEEGGVMHELGIPNPIRRSRSARAGQRVGGKWTQCEEGYDEPAGCLATPPEEGPDDRCIFRHCRTYQRDSKEFPGGGDVAHDGKPDCSLKEETLCREKEVCRTILLDAGIADEKIDRSLRAMKYEEEEGAPTDRRWTRSDVCPLTPHPLWCLLR